MKRLQSGLRAKVQRFVGVFHPPEHERRRGDALFLLQRFLLLRGQTEECVCNERPGQESLKALPECGAKNSSGSSFRVAFLCVSMPVASEASRR